MMKCVAIKVLFKAYFDILMNSNLGLLHPCKKILNYFLKFETIWYSKNKYLPNIRLHVWSPSEFNH